jgi:hypothetical protein
MHYSYMYLHRPSKLLLYLLKVLINDIEKVKLPLCLTKHYAMKTYGGVDV